MKGFGHAGIGEWEVETVAEQESLVEVDIIEREYDMEIVGQEPVVEM